MLSIDLDLTCYGYGVYVVIARDANGKGTPVAYFIVSEDTTDVLVTCLSKLKQHAQEKGVIFSPRYDVVYDTVFSHFHKNI